MKNTIFYSWQSDLPNNTNRGFIEACILSAIKELKNSDTFHLELNLDRDTKDELGTPDIVNTIFSKIERSKLFIADISLINPNSDGRKTPNPNVLLELGYASKVLGWERIICVFNTDYGDFNDLPFDLKFRRPLSYSLEGKDKAETKKYLTKAISRTIHELHTRGMLDDELNDYFKMQVDTQILSIINHLYKIMYGYDSQDKLFNRYNVFLNLRFDEIKTILMKRKFIGFQVYKNYKEIERELRDILENIISSSYYKKEIGIIIVNLIKWLNKFDKFNSLRQSPDLFISTNEKVNKYDTLFGPDINSDNKERYLLIEKLDYLHGGVVDFGDFQEKQKIDLMLDYVFMNDTYTEVYANHIYEFIQIVERWLSLTNNEFIVDNITHFEISIKETYQKRLERLERKPFSLKEELKLLCMNEFNFDYMPLAKMNALIYLVKLGFILKNHDELLKYIHRHIKGKIKINGDFSVTPLEEDLVRKELSENEKVEGLKKLNQARQGIVNIDYIYITHAYANIIDTLTNFTHNPSLQNNIKEIISNIIEDSKDNLFLHLRGILKNFVINFCKEDNLKSIDQINVHQEFNNIRHYHERDINKLKSEIRKLLKHSDK